MFEPIPLLLLLQHNIRYSWHLRIYIIIFWLTIQPVCGDTIILASLFAQNQKKDTSVPLEQNSQKNLEKSSVQSIQKNNQTNEKSLLQWIPEEPTLPSEQDIEHGIVLNRRGWFQLALQDCSQPPKRQAGKAKYFCDTTPNASQIQEYELRFEYMPDDHFDQFPFGIPLEFVLRLDKIEIKTENLWQVELINPAEDRGITMYRQTLKDLPAFSEKQNDPDNPTNREQENTWLMNLLQKLELESYQFLYQYFLCLRGVKSTTSHCNA